MKEAVVSSPCAPHVTLSTLASLSQPAGRRLASGESYSGEASISHLVVKVGQHVHNASSKYPGERTEAYFMS